MAQTVQIGTDRYPVELFRTSRLVLIMLPSGVTTVSETTFSLVVPYFGVDIPEPAVDTIPPCIPNDR